MLSADRVPVKSTQSKLHWLKWGVPIFGSTGWVHYPFASLSNLVSASGARAYLKRPGVQALGNVCHVS